MSHSMDTPTAARGSTLRLTAAEEGASLDSVREKLRNGAFTDWPNEAGFDGLTEVRGPIELDVVGSIPGWACGRLYRTGPAGCTVKDTRTGTFNISHWFDGLAHSHCFEIRLADQDPQGNEKDGAGKVSIVKVAYSSRRQSDEHVKHIQADGMIKSISFGQRADPCVGFFSKLTTAFTRPSRHNNICVTVNTDMPGVKYLSKKASQQNGAASATAQGHRNPPETVFIGTDSAWLNEVDPTTLESLGLIKQSDLHNELTGPMGPAHGHYDSDTGDYFNLNIKYGPATDYRVFKINGTTGETSILARFQSSPAYIHSFWMTANYIIICVPVAHLALYGVKVVWTGSLLDAFVPFDNKETCKWVIVDRRGNNGVVAEFASPAAFFFHSVNAFEDEKTGDILCDMVSYPDSSIITHFYYDILLNRNHEAEKVYKQPKAAEMQARLVRFRFPKAEFKVETKATRGNVCAPSPHQELQIRAPHVGDLPTINPAYRSKPYRYVYTVLSRGYSTLFDAIGKTDVTTGEVLLWQGPHGHTPGEAIFVARPAGEGEAVAEDDGVLLTIVLDGQNRKSYLLCLDAKTMAEMGRAECQFAVGHGFHGTHVKA